LADPVAVAALAGAAGIVGGMMNALAGGGTFATIPALVALGLPSPVANATSNVSLQPGAVAAAWTYRDGLAPIGGVGVWTLAAITFAGGVAGSALLVVTPTRAFDLIVPWLLLIATIALAAGPAVAARLRGRTVGGPGAIAATQALLGTYGGYFGGAVGIMATAAWGVLTGAAPHRVAAQRTLTLAIANAAAAVIFIATGMVRWTLAVPMLAGSVIGGIVGARLGRVLPPAVIRGWTLAVSATTTAVFFWRAYG
jgi:uncharacterized membrane protein YfcA